MKTRNKTYPQLEKEDDAFREKRTAIKKVNKRKYNLNYKIRKQGYRLDCSEKTIYAAYGNTVFSKQVNILRKEFNYEVQFEIR